ncbi:helicase C-terminal domain protein [Rhodococcus erythropolis SK121]|nr:helicase C-terminal domain protein [Rhodococcus erythropolis SK121]
MSGNFGFLEAEWPQLHAEARKAERDALFDPRTTCFYARRTVELTVKWLFQVEALPQPYKDDLSARIHEPEFVSLIGHGLQAKMNLIRKLGNTAVHDQRPIPPDAGLKALAELFHILSWLARRYASQPSSKPDPKLQFNRELLRKPAGQAVVAKTIAQMGKLEQELEAKDTQLAQSEAQKKLLIDQLQARDAEFQAEKASTDELIATLRAQVAAVGKAGVAAPDTHDYNEAQTRSDIIDLLLREAGWTLDQDRDREYPVTGMPGGKNGFVDYVLWGRDHKPLAVVEAKRTNRDPEVAQQQAKLYADCLEQQWGQRPVIYYTNGYDHHFWDDLQYSPRPIQGFHTRDELELLIQRRTSRKKLAELPVPTTIVERPYQSRAIRRVTERFDGENQREALLVMATGSGKTRTVIALTDILTRANWVKRTLFLADRIALVNQAANAFKTFLPDSSPVNLLTEKTTDGRVYLATYPTMMGLINQIENGQRRFGPGYFDLIVIDEAHRSVYQKYRHIFNYFDSLLVGLTATPRGDIDHNTYQLFNLEPGVPTDEYKLEKAIEDGYLVPPRAVTVPLTFQSRGINYDDLTEEERDEWESADWGDEDTPDRVEAEAVNKWLFNTDTVDKALKTLMTRGHKVAGGDRLGKTVIFAKNNAHAEFISERFNKNYPEYKGAFARVITHKTEHSQSLIDDFSQPEKAPHIAISVDMLDTGIDVPEIVNLVFFKPVRSKTKFWQMVGRGTRLRPDLYGPGLDKKDFFIFDLCGNFDFFKAHPDASEGSVTAPLSQRLFTARTELLTHLTTSASEPKLQEELADILHTQVQGMQLENFLVRPKRRYVEKYSERPAWDAITKVDLDEIVENLAALPTAVRDDDENAKRFDLLLLQTQLAVLDDLTTLPPFQTRIRDIADGLLEQLSIPAIRAQEELLREVAGEDWWIDVTLPMLEAARRKIRTLVGLLEKSKRPIIYTDFTDTLGDVEEVDMPYLMTGTDTDRFNAKVRDYLYRQPDNLAFQKLRTGKPLTAADLASLQQLLETSGIGSAEDVQRAVDSAQGLGRFIRSLVGLDRQAATEAFADFLNGRTATSQQIDFVNLIISHLTRHGVMDPGLLYEPPFTDKAPMGLDQVFDGVAADRIVTVLREINDSAQSA